MLLSDEFYNEVSSHPLPNDLDAVKVLAASPAGLDLCVADLPILQGYDSRSYSDLWANSGSLGRSGP
jgi:hypothetical protein